MLLALIEIVSAVLELQKELRRTRTAGGVRANQLDAPRPAASAGPLRRTVAAPREGLTVRARLDDVYSWAAMRVDPAGAWQASVRVGRARDFGALCCRAACWFGRRRCGGCSCVSRSSWRTRASLIVVGRPSGGYSTLWDGWVANIALALPIVPVWLRVRYTSRLQFAWAAMAGGIALNSISNVMYLLHDKNLHPVPSPAPNDIVSLLSYAALIVGVAAMTQRSFGPGHASIHFDGLVAGLAIGAAAAMLWFKPLLDTSGGSLHVAVVMAAPLCDLVLLVLLVAGLAPQRYRPSWSTGLLMIGASCFVLGNVDYLNHRAAGSYGPRASLDATWMLGTFFIAVAAWRKDERRSASRSAANISPPGIALVPVVFGLVSLAVLVGAQFRPTSAVATGMAIAALGVVILRMALTLREVRIGSDNFRDARTDVLTGLQNRRGFLEDAESRFETAEAHQRIGVLLVDLDGFKEVNDTLGHHNGDELLRIVGERFRYAIGESRLDRSTRR